MTDRLASNGRRVGRRSTNGRVRLTPADVAAIRGHYRSGVTAAEIARAWAIHPSRVYQLIEGLPRHTGRWESRWG